MMKNITLLASLALLVFMNTSCKRTFKESDTFTPNLKSADANFGYLDENSKFNAYGWRTRLRNGLLAVNERGQDIGNFVDFSVYTNTATSITADSIGFGFKFNQEVSYKVRVVGANSGAVCEISRTGTESIPRTAKEITASGVFWTGAATGPVLFRDSLVYTYLDVYKDGAYVNIGRDSIFISKVILPQVSYTDYKAVILISNFEANNSGNPDFGSPYSDAALAAEKAAFTYNLNFPNSKIPNGGIEGDYSLYWKGEDVNYNSYVAGTDENNVLVHLGQVKSKDPDSVFVNAYVYGTGKVGTSVLMIVWEQDNTAPYTFTTNSKYEIDRFGVEYPITWEGWRLISIPYSAFKKLNGSYGNGNGKLNPDRFGGISIGIDSYPLSGKVVEYYIDYIVVTDGAPFKQ